MQALLFWESKQKLYALIYAPEKNFYLLLDVYNYLRPHSPTKPVYKLQEAGNNMQQDYENQFPQDTVPIIPQDAPVQHEKKFTPSARRQMAV